MKNSMLQYRKKNKLTQGEAAALLGVSQPLVARLERDRGFQISAEMAVRIERASNGEISRAELRPDLFG